jgi:hypothetical protein
MIAEARCDTAAAVGRGVQIADGTVGSRIYQIGAGAVRLYATDGTTTVTGGASITNSPASLPVLASSPATLEIIDRVVSGDIWVGGRVNLGYKRDLTTLSGTNTCRWVALAGTTMDIRHHCIVTWTP